MLLQYQTTDCIEVVNSLEIKVSPTSVDNVATLISYVVAALWQRRANVVSMFTKSELYKVTYNAFQRYFHVTSANILVFN